MKMKRIEPQKTFGLKPANEYSKPALYQMLLEEKAVNEKFTNDFARLEVEHRTCPPNSLYEKRFAKILELQRKYTASRALNVILVLALGTVLVMWWFIR